MTTEITRYRGDTISDEFTVTSASGDAVDITAADFVMTIDTLKAPPDDTTKVATLVGVVTDGPAGRVEFPFTEPDADQAPGKYFYDIQMTDSNGKIQTLTVGTYIFKQDITKT
jgi:hypothetical protein